MRILLRMCKKAVFMCNGYPMMYTNTYSLFAS